MPKYDDDVIIIIFGQMLPLEFPGPQKVSVLQEVLLLSCTSTEGKGSRDSGCLVNL